MHRSSWDFSLAKQRINPTTNLSKANKKPYHQGFCWTFNDVHSGRGVKCLEISVLAFISFDIACEVVGYRTLVFRYHCGVMHKVLMFCLS